MQTPKPKKISNAMITPQTIKSETSEDGTFQFKYYVKDEMGNYTKDKNNKFLVKNDKMLKSKWCIYSSLLYALIDVNTSKLRSHRAENTPTMRPLKTQNDVDKIINNINEDTYDSIINEVNKNQYSMYIVKNMNHIEDLQIRNLLADRKIKQEKIKEMDKVILAYRFQYNLKNQLSKTPDNSKMSSQKQMKIIKQTPRAKTPISPTKLLIKNGQIEAQNAEIKKLQNENYLLTEENENLKQAIEQNYGIMNDIYSKLGELNEKLAALTYKKNQLTEKMSTLNDELKNKQESNKLLANEIETLKSEIEKLNNEKNRLNRELSTKNSENENLTQRINELESKLSGLESKKNELEENITNLSNEKNVLNEQITALKSNLSEMENLKAVNANLTNEINEYKTTVSELNRQIEGLNSSKLNGKNPFSISATDSFEIKQTQIQHPIQSKTKTSEIFNIDQSENKKKFEWGKFSLRSWFNNYRWSMCRSWICS